MNTTDLIPWTRKEATLSQYSTEYTPTVLLQMLNFTMSDVFEPILTNARSGYWLHTFTRELGVNNPDVRLPPRATPAIEQVDISNDGLVWRALEEVLEAEAQDWETEYYREQYPHGFVIRGSYVHLIPAAKVAGIYLRVKTTVRPSVLVEAQTTGRITAVDTSTRVITVADLPVTKPGSTPISGYLTLDAIEPLGNFELSLVDAPCTVLSSTTVQVATGHSLQRVAVGDYLRVANQSEWPMLPEAFHRLVGSITAIPICQQRDLIERSAELSTACSNTLGRLNDHLRPRVRVQQHKPMQHSWRD